MEGIESVLAQTIPVRIFAINNGSKDNVPNVLNKLGNNHVVTHHYPQLGVSGAWNFGLQYLFNIEKAERVLVVNQDITLRPDTYEILDAQNRGFVSAVSRNSKALYCTKQAGSSYPTRPHPDFSCYLIQKDCYKVIGLFDEEFYPAWHEDNDYHIRAARAGIELVCIDLPFYHYAAATMKTASEYDKAHYYGPAFLKSKQRFQDKWNCLPGTKQYEEMCNPVNWVDGMYVIPEREIPSPDNLP